MIGPLAFCGGTAFGATVEAFGAVDIESGLAPCPRPRIASGEGAEIDFGACLMDAGEGAAAFGGGLGWLCLTAGLALPERWLKGDFIIVVSSHQRVNCKVLLAESFRRSGSLSVLVGSDFI